MLNTSVELYLSGSRVLIVGPVFSDEFELPLFEFEFAFEFAFMLALAFGPVVVTLQPVAMTNRLNQLKVPTIVRNIFRRIDTSLKRRLRHVGLIH
jgi:hypothetical protein